jgi:hypothetical protein
LAGIIAVRDDTRPAAASAIINFIGDSLSRENPHIGGMKTTTQLAAGTSKNWL